ncbi:MAG: HD domain-containing protein [Bacillota bacterium]|nr:HD domain-containing protein [Bacillota bacterium]
MSKEQYARDIRPQDPVETEFILAQMSLRPLRGGSGEYLSLVLVDKTGQIQGRVWNNAAAVAATLREKRVVSVRGKAEDYRGEAQISVYQATLIEDPTPALLAELVPQAPVDLADLRPRLAGVIAGITDPALRGLGGAVLDSGETGEAFAAAPAAKVVHHAYPGGLLEHSLEVAALCEAYCAMFPALQRDLLITAALLHDLGKVREYSVSETIELTDEGRLVGHVAVGLRLLDQALSSQPGFPPDLAAHLTHILLSHHGEMENGAPIVPQTMEAMALHLADLTSARLKQFEQLLAACGDSAWSQYDRLLNRSVYGGFAPRDGAAAGRSGRERGQV